MQVICLEEEAFYQLIDKVVDRIKEKNNIKEDKWLSPEEAMEKLKARQLCKNIEMKVISAH